MAFVVCQNIGKIFAQLSGGLAAKTLGEPSQDGSALGIRARTSAWLDIFIG